MDEEEDRLRETLAAMYRAAREHINRLNDDAEKDQFRENQCTQGNVVYGVWSDPNKPRGIDYEMLKGSEHQLALTNTTVVPCDDREQAIQFRTMFCQP